MNVLDLFSGIGGFSLGLERAGMRTVAFCEIDPFCREVLRKHWPTVPIHDDVRQLRGRNRQVGYHLSYPVDRTVYGPHKIDVICGGFPCQDISLAGAGLGIEGERSGLWSEYSRLIGEIRPRFVIVENVSALLHRGMDKVLGDLATLGYDAEWHCIPASAIGAIHDRDRLWIIAYPNEAGVGSQPHFLTTAGIEASRRDHADRLGLADLRPWTAFADILRAPYGLPGTMDRLKGLGNAVVPQIPEAIGRAIMNGHIASAPKEEEQAQ